MQKVHSGITHVMTCNGDEIKIGKEFVRFMPIYESCLALRARSSKERCLQGHEILDKNSSMMLHNNSFV